MPSDVVTIHFLVLDNEQGYIKSQVDAHRIACGWGSDGWKGFEIGKNHGSNCWWAATCPLCMETDDYVSARNAAGP